MSNSKYFGKCFATVAVLGSDEHGLAIVDPLDDEELSFASGGDVDRNEAILGLVDTLRVTRKLLLNCVRKLGVRITDPNEFHREIIAGAAHKIGESPEDVMRIFGPIITELVKEMVAKPSKKK